MFCNKCGNELISESKFCGKCGQKVEEEESSTLSGVEPTGSLQEMSTVTEGKDSIISVLLIRIKQRKYSEVLFGRMGSRYCSDNSLQR